jgi:hypothetical protein
MKVTLLTIKDCWKQPTEEDQAAVDQNNNFLYFLSSIAVSYQSDECEPYGSVNPITV